MLFILMTALAGQVATLAPAATSASSNNDLLLKNYPPRSLQKGEQGPVGFEVTVESDGFMSGCTIKQSSGFADLDRGTCEFLARHGKFRPVTDRDGNRVRVTHEGRINWRLPGGLVQPAAARTSAPTDRLELICKRYPKPGSKVRKVKICATPDEWKYGEQVLRDELQRTPKAPGVNR